MNAGEGARSTRTSALLLFGPDPQCPDGIRGRMACHRRICLAAMLASGCAGPSQRELHEQAEVTERIAEAHAVYLPPGSTPSCIGRTLRAIRMSIHPGAIEEAMTSGLTACLSEFHAARQATQLAPDAASVALTIGVDAEGRACAVVELSKPSVLDPRLMPLAARLSGCAKDVAFASPLPPELIREREDSVGRIWLPLDGRGRSARTSSVSESSS